MLGPGVRVIDKLDVRVPAFTPFASEMASIASGLKKGCVGPFVPSRYYRYMGDLRKLLGIDAVLHLEGRQGEHNHKIEIIDAGTKCFSQMLAIISRIFRIDPLQLEVMRIDLAADVDEVPVHWFRENARFAYKQFASSIDKSSHQELEFIGMGNALAQSLYAGRKPNCIRIYDKIAELRVQWHRLKRTYLRYNKGLSALELTDEQKAYGLLHIPTFEQFCTGQGFDPVSGKVVTRVERQIGGDRIPEEIDRICKLQCLPEFDPFEHVRIVANGGYQSRPSLESWGGSIRDYLAGIGLQTLVSESGGVQRAFSTVTRFGNGNGKRVLESLQAFIPASDFNLTTEGITRIFRGSVQRQLAA